MQAVLIAKAGYCLVFLSRWTHLSYEWPSPFAQIDQGEHRECAIGVLGQATVANLGEAPDALERQERMLDFGTHARFAPIGFFVGSAQGPVPVCRLVGEVFRSGRNGLEPLALQIGRAHV